MKHLEGLNEKQKEAAEHVNGPLLIVAGAGAGKTKTMTCRIINLIKQGTPPEKILAITFTNKAAKELRDRVISEINKNTKYVNTFPLISTFHALGVYMIKENARFFGLNKHFSILDEGDTTGIVKDIIKGMDLDYKKYEPRRIKSIISIEKGKLTNIDDYINEARNFSDSNIMKIVANVWEKYEKRKAKENSLDFDDLLIKPLEMLTNDQEIRNLYQERWSYINVDEYQDTNEVQYRITNLLAKKHKNICVVGDVDQNIYSWRGANLKNILNFKNDYENAETVLLEENYRSTKNILLAANAIIAKNQYREEKNLFTNNATGEKISFYHALTEKGEADFIAKKILEIQNEDNAPEIAILYRTNFQSRILEEAMLKDNIPYQVLGIKFFERKEIKDTLAYLRAALNPGNLSDIKRIINFPARGIGKATQAKVFSGDRNNLPVKIRTKIDNFYKLLEEIKEKIYELKASDVIKFLLKRSGIEEELKNGPEEEKERLENIKELVSLALKYDDVENGIGIEKLLENAALYSEQDYLLTRDKTTKKNNDSETVKLMTIHAAKGLEFKYVFITGLEQGLFPHESDEDESIEDSEEERRLFYVALTRAKEKLFLSFTQRRTIFGSQKENIPSEFLFDIPKELLERNF